MATKSNPKAPRPSAQERQWQAESDARTLIDAERIKSDKVRLTAAKVHAQKQAALLAKVSKK